MHVNILDMETARQQTPARRFEKVCAILEQNGNQPQRLIPILQAVQEEYRYLPEDVLTFVATGLDVPPARVFGVATFYSHLNHLINPLIRNKFLVEVALVLLGHFYCDLSQLLQVQLY